MDIARERVEQVYAELRDLIEEVRYSNVQKERMRILLEDLGLTGTDESEYALVHQIRGKFLSRRSSGRVEVIADGRADWVGWIELKLQ